MSWCEHCRGRNCLRTGKKKNVHLSRGATGPLLSLRAQGGESALSSGRERPFQASISCTSPDESQVEVPGSCGKDGEQGDGLLSFHSLVFQKRCENGEPSLPSLSITCCGPAWLSPQLLFPGGMDSCSWRRTFPEFTLPSFSLVWLAFSRGKLRQAESHLLF